MKKIICLILFLCVSVFADEPTPIQHWFDGYGDFTIEQNGKTASYSSSGPGVFFMTDGTGADYFIVLYDGTDVLRGGLFPESDEFIGNEFLAPLSGEAVILFRIHRNIILVTDAIYIGIGVFLSFIFFQVSMRWVK